MMFARYLRAVTAVVILAAILVGLPMVLSRFGTWPITGVPSIDQVRDLPSTIVSDTAIFGVLTVLAWIAWLLFVASFVSELAGGIAGREATRIPLAGPLQVNARRLVAALLMSVSIAGPFANMASASGTGKVTAPIGLQRPMRVSAPAPEPTMQAADLVQAPLAEGQSLLPGRDDTDPASLPSVTITRGQNAWNLAETHLGDGMRWREIFELNRGLPQPDGRSWVDPQSLEVGWIVRLPIDATGVPEVAPTPGPGPASPTSPQVPSEVTVAPGDSLSEIAGETLGDPGRYPELVERNRDRPQPDGDRLTDPDLIRPGWQISVADASVAAPSPQAPPPSQAAPVQAAPVPAAADTAPGVAAAARAPAAPSGPAHRTTTEAAETPAVEDAGPEPRDLVATRVSAASEPAGQSVAHDTADEADDGDEDERSPLVWPGAGMVAAGVVLALDHRRRRQHRRRQPGERVPVPNETLRGTERVLRGGADPRSAQFVDAAIRRLAVVLAGLEAAPTITGAELAPDGRLTVVFADRCALPPPFVATVDSRRWILDRPDELAMLAPTDPVVAPVPTLVTIATNADGARVLLNLEQLGLTAVVGDRDAAKDLVTTIALELAHNPWSDALTVYAVGLDARFATFDRVTWAPRLSDVLDTLTKFDRTVSTITDDSPFSSAFDARLHHAVADTWNAALVVCVVDPEVDADDLARLAELADGDGLVCAIVAGSDAGATCRLAVSAEGVIVEPGGWEYSISNRIPGEQIDEMFDLVDLAEAEPVPATEDEPADPGTTPGTGLVIETEFQPFALPAPGAADVAVLGPVEVIGAAGPIRWAQSLGEIVYLALHREGASDKQVMEALWPGQAPNGQRLNKYTSQARKNMGDGPNGAPLFPYVTSGRYRLSSHVTCDYDRFTAAVRHARQNPRQARSALAAGLELVRGVPFTTNRPDFYEWTHVEGLFYAVVDEIIDAAHHLAELALEAGDGAQARWAAQTGLKASPISEILWRDLMRIHGAAGDVTGVQRTWTELCRALDEDDPDDYLHPDTVELYQQLTRRVRPARR
jgi:nucleoid-associated protein YgaU/DNA-binding SARP family transcriptional activator